LIISKVEAGKLEMEMVPVSVEGVCQASLRLVKQNAHKKRLRIGSSYDSTVSVLMADERRMKQILVNLLSNAVKFTPAGGQIGLDVIGDELRRLVHVTVWDTGIGIAEEDKNKLFQPFVQLDSRLSREYTGTGLGLSLVSRMMDLHGGYVSVESEIGRGSRFTVTFPWKKPPDLEAEEEQRERPLLPIGNVLLIEDSPAATAQIKRYLREMQIEVAVYSKATNAVDMAAKVAPDLVILDIMLPDGSGWEVLAQLKGRAPAQRKFR
jgi:CheY-like chemotaxis protein